MIITISNGIILFYYIFLISLRKILGIKFLTDIVNNIFFEVSVLSKEQLFLYIQLYRSHLIRQAYHRRLIIQNMLSA